MASTATVRRHRVVVARAVVDLGCRRPRSANLVPLISAASPGSAVPVTISLGVFSDQPATADMRDGPRAAFPSAGSSSPHWPRCRRVVPDHQVRPRSSRCPKSRLQVVGTADEWSCTILMTGTARPAHPADPREASALHGAVNATHRARHAASIPITEEVQVCERPGGRRFAIRVTGQCPGLSLCSISERLPVHLPRRHVQWGHLRCGCWSERRCQPDSRARSTSPVSRCIASAFNQKMIWPRHVRQVVQSNVGR